jgi:hypothetical protein
MLTVIVRINFATPAHRTAKAGGENTETQREINK